MMLNNRMVRFQDWWSLGKWGVPLISIVPRSTLSNNKYPGYDTQQSDGEVPVMLEFGEMRITPNFHRPQVSSDPEW